MSEWKNEGKDWLISFSLIDSRKQDKKIRVKEKENVPTLIDLIKKG